MIEKMWNWRGFMIVVAGLSVTPGCATCRYTSTSGTPDVQKMAANKVPFHIESIRYQEMATPENVTEGLSTKLLAPSAEEIQRLGRQRFPGLFSEDASAIPLQLSLRGHAYKDKSVLNFMGNMLAAMTLQLVVPFVDSYHGEYALAVEAYDEVETVPSLKTRQFRRKDTMCISIFSPSAFLNLVGGSRKATWGTMEGLVNTNIGYQLTMDCLLDEVACAVQQLDTEEWQKFYAGRQARVVRTVWDGHPVWLRVVGSEPLARQVAVYGTDPAAGSPPLELVTVARRSSSSSEWEVQPGYATTAQTPILLGVPLEGGKLGRPNAQAVVTPDIRDFLSNSETDPAVARWRTSMLIYAKNRTLPVWLQTKSRTDLQDLLSRLEANLLELAHESQMARSRAQHLIETNAGDPMKERKWSAIFAERMAVLQAIMEPIKKRLSET